MKLHSITMFLLFSLIFMTARSQTVGVGVGAPTEKMDVNGKVKTNALILNLGGSTHDFLIKNAVNGEVGFKKASGGLGLNYIIRTQGILPSAGGVPQTTPFIGEIKLFAGTIPPYGWAFCDGQEVMVSHNTALFALIGTTYGGFGQILFRLPDLRGAVPVGVGTASAGYDWLQGEKHW